MKYRALAAAVVAAALVGCTGSGTSGSVPTEQKLADGVTRAVYDNDVAGVTEHFDDALRRAVSREEVGVLSDKMHSLGDYQGLQPRSVDLAKHRYEYEAAFSKGSLTIRMRLDPDGKIAGYRIVPQSQ